MSTHFSYYSEKSRPYCIKWPLEPTFEPLNFCLHRHYRLKRRYSKLEECTSQCFYVKLHLCDSLLCAHQRIRERESSISRHTPLVFPPFITTLMQIKQKISKDYHVIAISNYVFIFLNNPLRLYAIAFCVVNKGLSIIPLFSSTVLVHFNKMVAKLFPTQEFGARML